MFLVLIIHACHERQFIQRTADAQSTGKAGIGASCTYNKYCDTTDNNRYSQFFGPPNDIR